MDFQQRVMRVMTHLNVGVALGLVAWLAWSSVQTLSMAMGPLPVHPVHPVHPVSQKPGPALFPSCCGVHRT